MIDIVDNVRLCESCGTVLLDEEYCICDYCLDDITDNERLY